MWGIAKQTRMTLFRRSDNLSERTELRSMMGLPWLTGRADVRVQKYHRCDRSYLLHVLSSGGTPPKPSADRRASDIVRNCEFILTAVIRSNPVRMKRMHNTALPPRY